MTARYAIYFAPQDDSELELFGATVLRRRSIDAAEWWNPDLPIKFPAHSDWGDQIRRPAHYGFHATIKAPFELAEGQTVAQLRTDLEQFCNTRSVINLTGLAPIRTKRYDALAFDKQPGTLATLASDCVTTFEPYRAALSQADIERRDPAQLSDTQRDYLQRFGYPYILDDFNFHMTLSGRSEKDDADYLQWLQKLYSIMITETPVLDRLCIFFQPDRDTAFIRTDEFVFKA